ncbi:MAG: hypothetical protein A2283_05625 [Lentisphaerae bacterium RIFOXYA12_FULL_48_11]|nr:MAG: hypothetical protein A2283_05625 [Lentisphaerae bacterium RIFOXYA12_FULL_48_11]
MTGRERIRKAFQRQETDRVPWVPFVGCHAGSLIGVSAENYLKSADNIVKGLEKAIELYQPDGIPVVFDLQIEAETLGCDLMWAEQNPPSVSSHTILKGISLESLKVPTPDSGRIPIAIEATRRIREKYPDIAVYCLLTGPFTLALHLLGTDIFMKMFDEPAYVHRLMTFCSEVCKKIAGYYIGAGCDVIALVDPMTSQIGPDQFREFVSQYASDIFQDIRKQNTLSSFFVCGHAQQNVEAMCECQTDNISVDENIPLEFVRDICLSHNVSFGGNIQLTSVLLLGTPIDSQRNAITCVETAGNKGFILSPGCDLPYSTPAANLQAITKIVHDNYERDVVKAIADDKRKVDLLNLADYGQADKVIVDIITLDSEACAPCQYMVESVKAVAPEFEGIVIWREHKIKHQESLIFMTSLMVRNVPTICIDGEIRFVSRIPARDDLIAAIQKRINDKLRIKIQRRKASLLILGDGGEACKKIEKNAKKAIKELGADIDIVMVTDSDKVTSYGFLKGQTPATLLARYQTKTTQIIPEVAIIKEWIKDVT